MIENLLIVRKTAEGSLEELVEEVPQVEIQQEEVAEAEPKEENKTEEVKTEEK